MRLVENFYYDNVLDYKYNIMKLLYHYKDDVTLTISNRDLLSLYLIDYENAGCDEYEEKQYKNILALYDQYNEDHYSSIDLTVRDFKDIIKTGQSYRISLALNKAIAGIFLDLFLKTHNNPYYRITQEQFDEICDHLLVE